MNKKDMKNISKCFYVFAGLFIILNILDIATTWSVLRLGGIEANPLARGLFGHIGYWWSCLIKIGVTFLAIGGLLWVKSKKPLVGMTAMAMLVGLIMAVVYSNFLVVLLYLGV